jgi:hypothetical protein
MSNRKPATGSKRARGSKSAARAQRTRQAIVRSPKDKPQGSVAAGSTESPRKAYEDSKQEAPIIENRADALQDHFSRMMRDNGLKEEFDFSLATANVQAYQAKLLTMAQDNMKFAFEFFQRLATIRSPFEILTVIAEFTSKRIDTFQKYSKEMAELSTKRLTV